MIVTMRRSLNSAIPIIGMLYAPAGISSAQEAGPSPPGVAVYIGYQWDALEGAYNNGIAEKTLVFYSSGWVQRGYPCRGLEAPGYEGLTSTDSPLIGRFGPEGDSVAIRWNSGDFIRISLANDQKIEMYGINFYLLPSQAYVGARLSGKYGRLGERYDGSRWPTISFNSDGTFYDEGFLGGTALSTEYAMHFPDREWAYGAAPRGSGNYSIGTGTLYLDYANGEEHTISLYVLRNNSEEGRAEEVEFCGYTFELKD